MWTDVLGSRREGSDALWLATHDWQCRQYKYCLGRSPSEIRDAVFEDPHIKILLSESPRLASKLDSILEEMSHCWSLHSIRFVGYFITKVMKSIYRNVWVFDNLTVNKSSFYFDPQAGSSVKQVIDGIAREAPIIYMPTHRSYADFLIFSYICFDLKLPLPAIAAGIDFLSLNQVASMLRKCGAFYIRRSFKHCNDSLYWEVFRAYVQTQLLGGERPIEFFIEGTRSRSGKSLFPKTGLLSVALDLFLKAQIPDLVIIPVTITYDRTLEEELYARELIPPQFHQNSGSKPKETTQHLISGARAILSQDYGSVYIKFQEPLSLREMCQTSDIRKLHSLVPRSVSSFKSDAASSFLNHISKQVICNQVDNLVLSPFTLFATVVLSDPLYASLSPQSDLQFAYFPIAELILDVQNMCSVIAPKNLSHAVFEESVESALIDSFEIHKKLVSVDLKEMVVRIEKDNVLVAIQLRHYSNQVMQLLFDAACCCFSDNYYSFSRIRSLLSREFISLESNLEADFSKATAVIYKLSDRVRGLLSSHVKFYLSCYLDLVIWLLSLPPKETLDAKGLAKEAQKYVGLTLDVIQNALHLLLNQSALLRADKGCYSIESINMQLISDQLHQLIATQVCPGFSPKIKPKL